MGWRKRVNKGEARRTTLRGRRQDPRRHGTSFCSGMVRPEMIKNRKMIVDRLAVGRPKPIEDTLNAACLLVRVRHGMSSVVPEDRDPTKGVTIDRYSADRWKRQVSSDQQLPGLG